MRLIVTTVTVSTAGVRVQVSNTKDDVLWIRFDPRNLNTAAIYVGDVTVSSTNGKKLTARVDPPYEIPIAAMVKEAAGGSVKLDTFFVDSDGNGAQVDVAILVRV